MHVTNSFSQILCTYWAEVVFLVAGERSDRLLRAGGKRSHLGFTIDQCWLRSRCHFHSFPFPNTYTQCVVTFISIYWQNMPFSWFKTRLVNPRNPSETFRVGIVQPFPKSPPEWRWALTVCPMTTLLSSCVSSRSVQPDKCPCEVQIKLMWVEPAQTRSYYSTQWLSADRASPESLYLFHPQSFCLLWRSQFVWGTVIEKHQSGVCTLSAPPVVGHSKDALILDALSKGLWVSEGQTQVQGVFCVFP